MPTCTRGPRLLKGAIVAIDPTTRQATPIVFQYKPEVVRRMVDGSETPAAAMKEPSEAIGAQVAQQVYGSMGANGQTPSL